MPAYVIFAENGGRRGMIYANIDRFPIDGDTADTIRTNQKKDSIPPMG
jgi:hypothetical protein